MLQVARMNYPPSSRMRGQQKPPDFLSRNKRAIREKSRAVEAANSETRSKTKLPQRAGTSRKKEAVNGVKREDTVVISKDYLDQLMRRSIMADSGQLPVQGKTHDHVVIDHGQIPGLSDISAQSQQQDYGVRNQPPERREHPQDHSQSHKQPVTHFPERRELSQHEQWLRDLAAQVEEKRQRKLADKGRQRQRTPEDYNPWGRPGCGAPIKDQSGQLLTDFRTRGRVGEEEEEGARMETKHHQGTRDDYIEAVHPSWKEDRRSPTPEDYNPWGRPGCGAPIKDQSGQLQTARGGGGVLKSGGKVMRNKQGKHMKTISHPDLPRHNATSNGPENLYDYTPRFGRGAGPYVDKFVLQQKAEKTKRDMEHMEFVRAQVAEKERQKAEERARKEREDRLEEERLAKERAQIDRRLHQEKEKARRKEEEKARHFALIQQRIAEAEEMARRNKEDARKIHHSSNSPHETPRHRTSSPYQYKREHAHADSRQSVGAPRWQTNVNDPRGRTRREENGRTNQRTPTRRGNQPSRIPVKNQSSAAKKPMARRQIATKVEPSRSRIRSISPPVPSLKRELSPPVPALAKRLSQAYNTTAHHPNAVPLQNTSPFVAITNRGGIPTNQITSSIPGGTHIHSSSEFHVAAYRSTSPPVPVLAYRSTSPPVPALAKKMQRKPQVDTKPTEPVSNPSDEAHSLPINRPPSCGLIVTPMETPSLPPIEIAGVRDIRTTSPVPAGIANRQHIIMEELAMLRQGIISQKLDIDQRVNQILTRQRFLV